MLIVNDNRTEVVRAEDIVHIMQGDNRRIVARTILCKDSPKPDVFLGSYESSEQAGIALNMLLEAMLDGRDVFFMPVSTDPALKVNTHKSTGGLSYRQGKTNGKNH